MLMVRSPFSFSDDPKLNNQAGNESSMSGSAAQVESERELRSRLKKKEARELKEKVEVRRDPHIFH